MDSVCLSDSSAVIDGLRKMLEDSLGNDHGYTDSPNVEVPIALLVIKIAKRSENRVEWFPRGKWATIQAISERIEEQIDSLCWTTKAN